MRAAGFCGAALSLALFGCQSAAVVDKPETSSLEARVAARVAALEALNNFEVRGGLGIWTDNESITARLKWRQHDDALDIDIIAPLGLGKVNLRRDANTALLSRGSEVVMAGDSAGQLLQQALGLAAPVPIDQMTRWLRGLPGEADSFKLDNQGRLDSLVWTDNTGLRWRARVLRYTGFEGMTIPALITAKGGPYNLRLVLKEWLFEPENEPRPPDSEGAPSEQSNRPEKGPDGRLLIPGQ
ncbi:MAG: lipoprotein insertase outer membrane protein LolB [Granulosicoccus sp.]